MIIPTKTANTILNEMMDELKSKSNITNFKAGSIARTLLEVINTQLSEIYSALNVNLLQSFVSTANGTYLEYIGELVGCKRLISETEEQYRYRITQQYLTSAKANLTAIRLACLSISGIKDVIIEEFLYGTGSFGVYIITDELVPSSTLIEKAQMAIDENKAFGIYAKALPAKIMNIEISYSVKTTKNTVADLARINSEIKPIIQKYFDNLGMGGLVDLTYLTRLPYTLFSDVTESRILELKVDNNYIYNRTSYQLSNTARAKISNIRIS